MHNIFILIYIIHDFYENIINNSEKILKRREDLSKTYQYSGLSINF